MKNKVEAQPRKVNKKNCVVKPIHDVDVKHSLLNANSEPICATGKKSLFDGVHDMCFLDFVKNVVQIVLRYLDSKCSKHMAGNRSQLMNFISKFLGTVRFKNDHIARIIGFRDTNLYIISLNDMLKTSSICLLSKASKTKSWLWHRRLSHLNFGKIKKSSYQPKAKDTNQEKLYLLYTDLCGPMRVASINRKKYILVIVDNYSRFTWVRFLRTKDEAPEAIIKCIKNIQVRLNVTVRNVRTDNGTKFVNQILCEFYENVGISHQTSIARTPQQNGVVERQNRTLVEAARTMLIFSKALLFLWAKAINTSCYTQNHSIICHRYNKTPNELMHDKKPDLSFFHVFGALCYPTNDNDDLGKLDAKANIAMASEQFSSEPGLQCMTPATSSSGLVPNSVSQQPCIPLNRDDWDHLFQPMFDEYFTPLPIIITPVQEVAAPRAVVLVDSPVSTSIDQDAPLSSTPSTHEQEQSPNNYQGFEESPKTPIFYDDLLNESPHEESTSQWSSSNVRQTHTLFEHISK
ncbi:retrovirus-related pol polyprotein from transposon TNT 1-94 [Tanacetum coccineum]